MTATLTPTPEQAEALAALSHTFATNDRAQLAMACGTGKTLVGRWWAQQSDCRTALVLLPSLTLVAQTAREWARPGGWPYRALIVCSDPTTAAGTAERTDGDGGIRSWTQPGLTVTVDPATAARFLADDTTDDTARVVFSTYHSAPVVAEAQRTSRTTFDLAVCDEAHRLAGRPRDEFLTVLDPRRVKASRRLFMTGTRLRPGGAVPTVGTPTTARLAGRRLTMDDHTLFGPVAHTVTFAAAIGTGRLVDYRVLVVARHRRDMTPAGLPAAALAQAAARHGVRRAVSYHGRVAAAARFAAALDGHAAAGLTFAARAVRGKGMPAAERAEALAWLGEPDAAACEVRLVANARCLVEGVDCPAADAVLFADPRTSEIDILQAVGRALRTAPGKTRGTVIVPVVLPDTGDDDSELAASAFAPVWAVLRGIRAHDERMAARLDTRMRDYPADRRRAADVAGVEFDVPDGLDHDALLLRMVEETTAGWDKYLTLLEQWAAENDGRPINASHCYGGSNLGAWAERQRVARRRGVLSAERAERLDAVPGWAWTQDDGRWLRKFRRYAQTPVDVSAPGVLGRAGTRAHAMFAAEQRHLRRMGVLDPERARRLSALPGWDWNPVPQLDADMVEALHMFVEFEKHADPPETHVEDGLELGRWLWAVRRRKLLGVLHPALEADVLHAAGRDAKGGSLFCWHVEETRWRMNFTALRRYARREGHTRIPETHVEVLPDGVDVPLFRWVAFQRRRHRAGELEAKYVGWLETVPGWSWESPGRRLPPGEPLDLGGHPHGTAKGARAGCPCGPCREYRRAAGRRHLARHRGNVADPVPAERARAHVALLRSSGAAVTVIAHVSGVPLSLVRALCGPTPSAAVERAHAQAVLRTRMEDLAGAAREGSRGRAATTSNRPVPAGPTLARLEALYRAGYEPVDVGRRLGRSRGLRVTGATVTARTADAVAALHARLLGGAVRENAVR